MNYELGSLLESVQLKSGLFVKKPTALEIYTNGIVLRFKNNEDKEFLFNQISGIKTFDYFAPNSVEYHFDIFNNDGAKISSISIPYIHSNIGTALLEAHMNFQLGENFPQQLADSDFILDNQLSWQKGKLIHNGRKGIAEYSPQQIDNFIIEKGCHYFTLKSSKDTLMLMLHDSPNCLTAIAVGKAIANIE